ITDTTANLAAHLNMQGHRILDVSKISGYLGKWSIDEEGTLMTTKVVTDEVVTKKLKVESGLTTRDRTNGEYYCVFVDNGTVKSEKGECSSSSEDLNQPTPSPEPVPDPEATSPTPSAEPKATPEPEATPEPVTETPTDVGETASTTEEMVAGTSSETATSTTP
ncbi:MAG: hypothetical protein HY617_01510, partial [Candidatus Sungbacteria bacterium]|nr:hypothetical protein [Candidatus Sungbacteria bacterium]